MPRPLPLTDPETLAVFLDLDGTLLEIAPRPDAVRVTPWLIDTLRSASTATGGALALVSGRAIADLDRLLEPLRLPASGIHGLELRGAGGELRLAREITLPEAARERLRQFAAANSGTLVEDKEHSIALHFRLAPGAADAAAARMAGIAAELGGDYTLQRGKMTIELRPAGTSKGSAIAALMEEPPFAGRRPVFIGDDITDEDGFACVNGMGGWSARVGDPGGATAAHYRLGSVEDVHQWLDRLAARESRDELA